jgi:hypothetical protein
MLCEQIVNADQSLLDEETLGMIYLGKKKTSSLGTNSFSCYEACYQYTPLGFRTKNWNCSFTGSKNLAVFA